MKIVFVTREGYNLPGARIRCYNFSKELNRYGINTEVLSFSDNLGAKDGENESQMILREKIRYNYIALKRLLKDKKAVLYIQRFNYHSFAPYLTHLMNANKIILDFDDWEMRENPRYYFGFYPSSKAHYFIKQLARRSIFCIAASRFLEKFLLEFNRNVYYIPSGVDVELFKPSFNNSSNNETIFSWIGTLHKKEYIDNINLALESFSVLRQKYAHIYFDIVGDGIYRSNLLQSFDRINDAHIRFKGWISPAEIPSYLDNIHVGLFPIAKNTKFNLAKSPTKLFEYMAMAKPTVSCDIGETTHIIKDGYNGFLAGTKEDFIEKMKRLIEDPDLRIRMGKSAQVTIENSYSLKVLGRRIYEIVKQI